MIGRPIQVLLSAALTQAKAEPAAPPLRHTVIVAETGSFRRMMAYFYIDAPRQADTRRLDGRQNGCHDADPVLTPLPMRYSGGVGRVRRLGVFLAGTAAGVLVVGGTLTAASALIVASAATARADVQGAPLAGSSSATLYQVSAGEWQTTVYLDTAALCAGGRPAGNTFSLVTVMPGSVTGAAAPSYPDGLACGAVDAHPVTEVKLSFTPAPALSAVPQSATLVVTPPQALLAPGEGPAQVTLTVRRIVSPWQYVGIPALCGGGLALLLIALLLVVGVPSGTSRRVHWGAGLLRTPLFAGAAWSFGDSWATSVTPLTALAGAVLTASGAVAGLVPGVDLSKFALLMALVGGLTTLAPLLFSALNSLFPAKNAVKPAPADEVVAASLWVMLAASCLTVVAIGAEIGFVGWVLGYDLLVASPSIRWLPPAVAGLTAALFLGYGVHSILTLVGQPVGTAKETAKKHSFLM
jgi:hypothetical protein